MALHSVHCQSLPGYDIAFFMTKIIPTHGVLGLLLILALAVTGCTSDKPSSMSSSDKERLTALEQEVSSLKAEASAREDAFKKELSLIRKSLDSIHSLLEIEKERPKAETAPKGDQLDDEINNKAKSFVSENLDRLLSITKKLLDKMEKEIDEQMPKENPAPKGDEI